jgi:hypothetical protein
MKKYMSDFVENLQRRVKEAEESQPALMAAKERARSVVEQASLNEAIVVIERLLAEVDTMPVAARFSRTRKMKENKLRPKKLLLQYEEMTEEKFKREQLRLRLREVREKILATITQLNETVMDMEATKLD